MRVRVDRERISNKWKWQLFDILPPPISLPLQVKEETLLQALFQLEEEEESCRLIVKHTPGVTMLNSPYLTIT